MPDFPGVAFSVPRLKLSTATSIAGYQVLCRAGSLNSAGAWPAANRAIYVPVELQVAATVVKMAFQVTTQSGNYDIGIYDYIGNRLVSKGSTAVPVAGIAVADIADTVLAPGVYFLALCIDNVTAAVAANVSTLAVQLQASGVQQQAVGAVTLPDPATFANPASNYLPLVTAHFVVTV